MEITMNTNAKQVTVYKLWIDGQLVGWTIDDDMGFNLLVAKNEMEYRKAERS